jgi:hypothetical protein
VATETVRFDLKTLTMGELAAAEYASGLTSKELLGSRTYQMLLGVFVQRLRSYVPGQTEPPSWSELTNLRVVDARSLLSPSEPDSPSETSNG